MILHKIKNFILILLILFSAIVLLLVSFVVIYRNQSTNIAKEINLMLENALADDMSNRMSKPYEEIRLGYKVDNEVGEMSIYRSDTVIHDKNIHQLSIDRRFQKALQTYLLQKNPINVNALDSLFQSYLREKAIIAKTAIRYIYEKNGSKDTIGSTPNCELYTTYYALQGIPLGVKDEMIIQGYAKIAPSYIIHRGKKLFIISSTLIGFLTVLLIYAAYRQVKQHHVPSTGLYRIDRYLTLNMDTLVLQHKNQIVTLTPQSAQILKHFLEAPDYYLEYEELEKLQWGNNYEVTRRREQAIARLRTSLEEITTMHLISVRGSGYKLVIGSKWNAKRVETFPIIYSKWKISSFIKRLFKR